MNLLNSMKNKITITVPIPADQLQPLGISFSNFVERDGETFMTETSLIVTKANTAFTDQGLQLGSMLAQINDIVTVKMPCTHSMNVVKETIHDNLGGKVHKAILMLNTS